MTLFRAFDLHRTGKADGVAHEDIAVHEIPLVEVVKWLEVKAKSGVLIGPKVYAGLFFITLAPLSFKPPDGEVQRGGKGHPDQIRHQQNTCGLTAKQ